MRSLVVIPTYNEAPNILPLVRAILAQSDRLSVVVVDDGSPDGTGELIEAEAQQRLHLIQRHRKLGLGSAHLAGFRFGLDQDFDLILTMDADGSHDPKHIPEMLALLETTDAVIGSRYVPGGENVDRAHRRLLSRFANWYTRVLLGLPLRDCTSGYRGYNARVLERINPFRIRSSGYSFLEAIAWRVHRAGFVTREVPIRFTNRTQGRSKIETREIFRAAWQVGVTALRIRTGRASTDDTLEPDTDPGGS